MLYCVPDRLAFLNDRLSLQDASRCTRELFILGHEAKRTKGKKKKNKHLGQMQREQGGNEGRQKWEAVEEEG